MSQTPDFVIMRKAASHYCILAFYFERGHQVNTVTHLLLTGLEEHQLWGVKMFNVALCHPQLLHDASLNTETETICFLIAHLK